MTDYNRDHELYRQRRLAEIALERAERAAWDALRPLPMAEVRAVLWKMLNDFDLGYSPLGQPPTAVAPQQSAPPPRPAARSAVAADTEEDESEEDDDDDDGDGQQAEDDGVEFDGELVRHVLLAARAPLRQPEIREAVNRVVPNTPRHKVAQWLHRATKAGEVVTKGDKGKFFYALKGTPAASAPLPRRTQKQPPEPAVKITDEAARMKLIELLAQTPTDDYQWLTEQIFGICTSPLRTKVRGYVHYLSGRPEPPIFKRGDGKWAVDSKLREGMIILENKGGTVMAH